MQIPEKSAFLSSCLEAPYNLQCAGWQYIKNPAITSLIMPIRLGLQAILGVLNLVLSPLFLISYPLHGLGGLLQPSPSMQFGDHDLCSLSAYATLPKVFKKSPPAISPVLEDRSAVNEKDNSFFNSIAKTLKSRFGVKVMDSYYPLLPDYLQIKWGLQALKTASKEDRDGILLRIVAADTLRKYKAYIPEELQQDDIDAYIQKMGEFNGPSGCLALWALQETLFDINIIPYSDEKEENYGSDIAGLSIQKSSMKLDLLPIEFNEAEQKYEACTDDRFDILVGQYNQPWMSEPVATRPQAERKPQESTSQGQNVPLVVPKNCETSTHKIEFLPNSAYVMMRITNKTKKEEQQKKIDPIPFAGKNEYVCNVPGDGNCMFYSVVMSLHENGYSIWDYIKKFYPNHNSEKEIAKRYGIDLDKGMDIETNTKLDTELKLQALMLRRFVVYMIRRLYYKNQFPHELLRKAFVEVMMEDNSTKKQIVDSFPDAKSADDFKEELWAEGTKMPLDQLEAYLQSMNKIGTWASDIELYAMQLIFENVNLISFDIDLTQKDLNNQFKTKKMTERSEEIFSIIDQKKNLPIVPIYFDNYGHFNAMSKAFADRCNRVVASPKQPKKPLGSPSAEDYVHAIPGKGNCLFESVVYGYNLKDSKRDFNQYQEGLNLRKNVVAWLDKNWNLHDVQAMVRDDKRIKRKEAFLTTLGKEGQSAGDLAIYAIQELYPEANFVLYKRQEGSIPVMQNYSFIAVPLQKQKNEKSKKTTIPLIFSPGHYDAATLFLIDTVNKSRS